MGVCHHTFGREVDVFGLTHGKGQLRGWNHDVSSLWCYPRSFVGSAFLMALLPNEPSDNVAVFTVYIAHSMNFDLAMFDGILPLNQSTVVMSRSQCHSCCILGQQGHSELPAVNIQPIPDLSHRN